MESIKLKTKYLDTQGIYDSTAGKTQDEINAGKVNTADYNPTAKTPAMTKAVGKDSNGELWTEPVESSEVVSATENWLSENIAQETGYVIDNGFTTTGAAADAGKTGEVFTGIKDFLHGINGSKNQLTPRKTLTRKTNNGITFTPVYDSDNNLQYISASGTATALALYDIEFFISDGYYLLFQANSNSDTFAYVQEYAWSTANEGSYHTISNSNNTQSEPNIAKYSSELWYRVRLRVSNGVTVQNKIFCPILTRFDGDIGALKINYARELFKANSSFLTDTRQGETRKYGIQSACYNPHLEKYFVFCGTLEKGYKNIKTLCIQTSDIANLKYNDSDDSVVKWTYFNIGHCNDCTYDPVNYKIIAGGNATLGDDEKDAYGAITPNSVSIINAQTGAYESTVQLPEFPGTDYITAIEFVNGFIYAAGYNNLYKYSFNGTEFTFVGQVGSMTYASARQAVGTIYNRSAYGDTVGVYRQGMFFYRGYFYRIMHVFGRVESFGCLVQYTLDGVAVGCKAFPLNCNQDEIETVVHHDGEIYALSGTSFFAKVIELSESQIQAPKYMALKENENLNDVWIIGDYESRNGDLTKTMLGRPTSLTTSFLMSVKQIGSQDLMQEIVAMPSKKYTRKYVFNLKAWTDWYVWETSTTDTTVSSVE